MVPRRIPPEYDAKLLVWANQNLSHRAIAARLEQEGIHASHVTVGSRLRLLRGEGPLLKRLESDVWSELELNLGDLGEAEARLRRVEELAMEGDTTLGVRPDLAIAHRSIVRRIELILNKHRFLQTAIDQGLDRRSKEAGLGGVGKPGKVPTDGRPPAAGPQAPSDAGKAGGKIDRAEPPSTGPGER
jgi:hypothetical protein